MFEPRRIYNWDGDNMDLIKELLEGSRLALARSITAVESIHVQVKLVSWVSQVLQGLAKVH